MSRRRFRARGPADSGAVAVETAFAIPVALAVLFLGVHAGFAVTYSALAEHAARAAARSGSIKNGASYRAESAVADAAESSVPALLGRPDSVDVTYSPVRPGGPREGDTVTVTVTYEPGLLQATRGLLFFLPGGDTTISKTVSTRLG